MFSCLYNNFCWNLYSLSNQLTLNALLSQILALDIIATCNSRVKTTNNLGISNKGRRI